MNQAPTDANSIGAVAAYSDPVLCVDNVSLAYKSPVGLWSKQETLVFKNLNFQLTRGQKLAGLGRNGAGKSTLLRVLAGIFAPTSGGIIKCEDARIALLALGAGYNPFLTGRDNVILAGLLSGQTAEQVRPRLEDIKQFSELGDAFERPVRTYSSGMRSRLAFSGALFMDVDILLIDEVLAVGDGHFRNKAKHALTQKFQGDQTVVLVTHSMGDARKLCDSAIWLEDGAMRQSGAIDTVADAYEASL